MGRIQNLLTGKLAGTPAAVVMVTIEMVLLLVAVYFWFAATGLFGFIPVVFFVVPLWKDELKRFMGRR